MATRRIISSEKTILENELHPEEKSNIGPAVPKYVPPSPETEQRFPKLILSLNKLVCYRHVIFKLLGFTFAMIVLPISSYFLTVHSVFKGKESKCSSG